MSTVIRAENLSKMYWIDHDRQPYLALRDVIVETVRGLFKRPTRGAREQFWALRDVSFELQRGDRVGVIGRNGAGKSTLLKILSRVTEPTAGRLRIRGRTASLLEVGTGFHPELTGRENIFLNGAVMGMSRAEIRRKFDEIVAFSEVEQFLDTPVKRYSSGMYVRLAFAVAAHLDPEILVVDEVLAVGDMQFQKKCLGKMQDVSTREGRTVFFVSHNLEAVRSLCTTAILLDKGTVRHTGNASAVLEKYADPQSRTPYSLQSPSWRGGSGGVIIQRVEVCDARGEPTARLTERGSAVFLLEADVAPTMRGKNNIHVGFAIDNVEGRRLVSTVSAWENTAFTTNEPRLKVRCEVPMLPLVPGTYLLSVSVQQQQVETLDTAIHCGQFDVVSNGTEYAAHTPELGYVSMPCSYRSY